MAIFDSIKMFTQTTNNKNRVKNMEARFYTIKELIKILKVSESWIMRRIKENEIPSYKMGRKRLFKKEDIDQWIESQKDEIKAVTR